MTVKTFETENHAIRLGPLDSWKTADAISVMEYLCLLLASSDVTGLSARIQSRVIGSFAI
jgi:hypothetical protein